MTNSVDAQALMDEAWDNYFALSDVLRSDFKALLKSQSNSQYWKRNFIRVSVALMEGYAHCFRKVCAVSFVCDAPEISKKEKEVLQSEKLFGAKERFRRTLSVAYKVFELEPTPDFGGIEWNRAQQVLTIRDGLMHPKTPEDLYISDELWKEIWQDTTWLFEQIFAFVEAVHAKYGS